MKEPLITVQIQDTIPIFHFRAITPPALDEYLVVAMPYLLEHIENYGDTHPFCYVIDLSESGMFPVKLMMDKASKVLKTIEKDPIHFVAYVIDNPKDEMLLGILNLLAARKLEHTRKVFTPHRIPEAVEWLKQMEALYVKNE